MLCLDGKTPVLIAADAPQALRLAAADLERDLARLFGGRRVCSKAPAIRITVGASLAGHTLTARESFAVCVGDEGVQICGADVLGAVYGVYDFEYRLLGIDPMTRFSGLFPSRCERLALPPVSYTEAPAETRYRGWFLNDEDLLTDFKAGGGVREIDYPFYGHVMHTDVLDMVLETALRCKMNLIIPSSFVDIMNPDEEKLVKAVIARGLYITQHHVEPMGVSWFSAAKYMRGQGLPENVSFLANREKMQEIWQAYAERWAVYRTQVVWQLGLRGKADRAVWKSDGSMPMDAAARGAIITDAIRTQHDILRRVLGADDFASTVTLWLEGAELYGKGYLQVPWGTTVVFSDVGYDQMFGEDFFTTPRMQDATYGVYYHAGFWTNGPHLAEACHPEKMRYAYARARERSSLYYSILNVANLRELHRSAHLNSVIVWEGKSFDFDRYMTKRYAFLFGRSGADVLRGLYRYYDCFAELGEDAVRQLCLRDGFYYRAYGPLPFKRFLSSDGVLRSIARDLYRGRERAEVLCEERLVESAAKFYALCNDWERLREELTDGVRDYFDVSCLLQAEYMLAMTKWLLGYLRMHRIKQTGGDRQAAAEAAAAPLRAILHRREIAQRGEWQGWYRGDGKIGVESLIRLTVEDIY